MAMNMKRTRDSPHSPSSSLDKDKPADKSVKLESDMCKM